MREPNISGPYRPAVHGYGWKLGDGFRAARAIMKGEEPQARSVLRETPLATYVQSRRKLLDMSE
jgi:hypothetical protein